MKDLQVEEDAMAVAIYIACVGHAMAAGAVPQEKVKAGHAERAELERLAKQARYAAHVFYAEDRAEMAALCLKG